MDIDRPEAEKLRASLIERMRALDARYPGEDVFASILTQLDYIGAFIAGDATSMPRRADINFGFLGMRFVREFDSAVAHDLATLDTYVEQRFGS